MSFVREDGRNGYLAFNVERQPISRLHRVEEDATLR